MLRHKVAIITGGSRGIGKSVAESLLENGAKVVIAARNLPELEETVNELTGLGFTGITGIRTDVADSGQVENLIEQTNAVYGPVDILLNVAGIQNPIGPLVEVEIDDWIKNIHVNLIGTMICTRKVLPDMISRRRGKIINFSGGGGTSPRPYFSAYASAKAGVVRFTETVAEEVKEFGIDVNTIAPGAVNTRMLDEIIQSGDMAGEAELREAIERKARGGDSSGPAAELAVFLASDESIGITGKLISAVWDNWKDFKNAPDLESTPMYTLRRIDGRNFIEVKE